jgi:hypothetical protein
MGTVTIPGLFNNSENSSEYTAANDSMIYEKSSGRKWAGPNLKFYPCISDLNRALP